MRFLWPQFLWLLASLPVLVALYVWLMRRRKKAALRYASLALVASAMGRGARLRRHIPPALALLALTAAILAIARPSAVITLPSQQRTIVLAMDVSLSMRARDVEPNRLIAAQAAAKSFVQELPPDIRIGIVSLCSHRGDRATADRRPRRVVAGYRSISAAVRDRHRERAHRCAGNAFSGRRHRPGSPHVRRRIVTRR